MGQLATLGSGQLNSEDGFLHLPAGAEPARLAGFDPFPGRSYLLFVRAAAGRPFSIQMIDRTAERALKNWLVPARATSSEHFLTIERWALGAPNRFELRNTTPGDLVVEAFEIRELRRAHSWLWRSARPLALVLLLLFGFRHRRALLAYLVSGADTNRTAAPTVRDRWVTGVVLIACFHVFLSSPVHQVLDSKYSTVVSHRLLTAGTLSLPADLSDATPEKTPYMLMWVGEDLYHFFPEAVAVLNAPFVAFFDLLGITPVSPDGVFLRHHEVRILTFAAAFQAAMLCALLFLLGRLFLAPAAALAVTAVFAFGTQIYSTVSRPYWTHAWALLLLAAGAYLLLSPRWRDRKWAVAAAASFLAWSFLCRPPMGLGILGLTAYFLIDRRRHFALFAAIGAVWGGLYFIYSFATFDQLLPPYYVFHLHSGQSSEIRLADELRLGSTPLRGRYLSGLTGTLILPSRGLFVYVPFLVLLPIVALRHRSRLPDPPLALIALVVCFAHWQLVSVNRTWWGGQSFGPRLFSDLLVWFFLLTAMVLPVWWRRARRGPRPLLAAQTLLVALLVAAAVFINARGANSQRTYVWRGDLADWRNPQFLAGLLPERREPTLAERLLSLRNGSEAIAREPLVEDLLQDESVPRRWIETHRTFATFVTWDGWTYGEAPAALVAINEGEQPHRPKIRLATWASPETYPITVRVEDGEQTTRHVLTRRGPVEILLAPLPPRSRRLYIVWSDKAWTPGEKDSRSLGVQLLAPQGAD